MTIPTHPRVVAFLGKGGAGKSTAATMFVHHAPQFYSTAKFAAPIRFMLTVLLRDHLDYPGPEVKHFLDDQDGKNLPIDKMGGATGRQLMQTLGTEWGRNAVNPDLWCVIASYKINAMLSRNKNLVFDDLRFQNEADLVRLMGGIIIGIRGHGGLDDTAGTHASETSTPEPDFWIDNTGTPADLLTKVLDVIQTYCGDPKNLDKQQLPD